MSRLIQPCKASSLSKTCLMGLVSSAPPRWSFRYTGHSVKKFCRYRQFLCSEITSWRNCQTPYYSLPFQQNHYRSKSFEESNMDTPKEIFLKDYKQPDYFFDTVDLKFTLGEEKTIVSSKIVVYPRLEGSSSPLVLDGVDLKLISLKVNGKELKEDDFHVDSRHLTLSSPPSGKFTLDIVTEIYPQKNTSLEGLYKSSGNFCTQCEAEGFRKITFYQDRPDIIAKYTCRIEADKSSYPVLLSNGNLIEQGELEGGKHYVVWADPFVKPCYLFALVAGQLESRDDTFITRSGRNVILRIWTPAQDLPKTAHAMYSLKAAMKWDEDVFGLEYDLDLFNIVAVPEFNMGAMENKSLNIFNSKLFLASPETATDADYAAILGVIGHEYFHNWTGNRVTCRDWFQLSLKEGLTVFRDQEFSSDMGSRSVKRIADVSRLRTYQFPQDAGPMAHPVRPHSYIKMDNFYTVTVYEKGTEVVRMYKTLLGGSGFRMYKTLFENVIPSKSDVGNVLGSRKRKRQFQSFSGMLSWLIHVAKHSDDPSVGLIPECSKWSDYGNEDFWVQALSVRAALLIRRHANKTAGEVLLKDQQKKPRMHPSMYEDDVLDHRSTEKLRFSKRIPLTKSQLCQCCNSCAASQSKHIIHREVDVVSLKAPLKLVVTDVEELPSNKNDHESSNVPAEREVCVGTIFQAEVPEWIGVPSESDSKWLGTRMWPPGDGEENSMVGLDPIGKGRHHLCNCPFPDSVECVRFHVAEKRLKLKQELGLLFYHWRFNRMGEEVSLSWTEEEEKTFKDNMRSNAAFSNKFWNNASRFLPAKTKEKLVSYYFNVYLVQRRSYQNRVTPKDADSDDDEKDCGSIGGNFGYKALSIPGSRSISCTLNKESIELV